MLHGLICYAAYTHRRSETRAISAVAVAVADSDDSPAGYRGQALRPPLVGLEPGVEPSLRPTSRHPQSVPDDARRACDSRVPTLPAWCPVHVGFVPNRWGLR